MLFVVVLIMLMKTVLCLKRTNALVSLYTRTTTKRGIIHGVRPTHPCLLLSSPQFRHDAVALHSTTSDAPSEGAYVETKAGERGYVVERLKGGWWKVALENDNAEGEKTITKLRATAMKVISGGIDSDSSMMTATSSSSGVVKKNRLKSAAAAATTAKVFEATETNQAEATAAAVEFELKTIQAPVRHQQTSKWVIFSDLHVKSTSIESCEQVLQAVHEAAVSRDAGIIFLGDFWHVRGALSVDLLNRVLRALEQWTQPVIMIPGNHDQVTDNHHPLFLPNTPLRYPL